MGTTLETLHGLLDASKRSNEKANEIVGRVAHLTHVPQIKCADGFEMSVQASEFHYCAPRDSIGPWRSVEVGFPTEKVEAFMPYIDGEQSIPTETVYGYVPIELVAEAIDAHGGFAA